MRELKKAENKLMQSRNPSHLMVICSQALSCCTCSNQVKDPDILTIPDTRSAFYFSFNTDCCHSFASFINARIELLVIVE